MNKRHLITAILVLLSLLSIPLAGVFPLPASAGPFAQQGENVGSVGQTEGLAESPWPMFQHDAQHTGRSPFVGPETNVLKWSFATGGAFGNLSSTAIGLDGTIYAGSQDEKLYAINPDGSLKWRTLKPIFVGRVETSQ